MHILELPSFFPPHGGLFCLEQAKALKARGHEVRIIACTQLGVSIDKGAYFTAERGFWHKEMQGIEVYGHYQHDVPKMVRRNTERWLRTVEEMFKAYKHEHGLPDIIHAHCCKLAGIAAKRIAEREGVPYVITEHLPSELYIKDFGAGWTRHQWLRMMMCEAYRNAKCVVPVAEELVQDTAQFFGSNYPYHAISNIIDTGFFAFREREPLEGRPFRFACLAIADVHRKGYDVLAEAWHNVKDGELHIAGQGTDAEAFRRLFADCEGVYFYGSLDKEGVRRLLYESDGLVLASRSEAQPLVLLEAMSTGIPVVATDITPQSERIAGACLIAETGSTVSLAEQMNRCRFIVPSMPFHNAICALSSPETVGQQLEEIFLSK